MIAAAPDILVRRGLDRGLAATIAASAAIHVGAVVVLLLLPGRLLRPAPKLQSYTVDLIAPDVVGGTNLIAGGGNAKPSTSKSVDLAKAAPALVEAKAASEPAAEPVRQVAKAVQEPPPPVARPQAAEARQPPPVAKPPEPVKPAPEPARPPEPAKAVEKIPETKPAAAAPKADEAKAIAKPAPPQPAANPPEPPKAEAKLAGPPKPPPPAKPNEAKVQPNPQTKAATDAAANDTAAARAAKRRDDEIAAAIQRRSAQVPAGPPTSQSSADREIAAAVQRRAQQLGSGSGSGAAGPGGPVSVGPGAGAGGTSAGLEYILYQGRMEQKIKAAWAWAGADKSLRAVIQFNLGADGQIENIRTIESSGDRQYDASCERAVRAVNPLEPVPEKYRKEFAIVELTFKPSDLEP